MGEMDLDSNFYPNVFDKFESQNRLARVSKNSIKNFSATKTFQFCELKI